MKEYQLMSKRELKYKEQLYTPLGVNKSLVELRIENKLREKRILNLIN